MKQLICRLLLFAFIFLKSVQSSRPPRFLQINTGDREFDDRIPSTSRVEMMSRRSVHPPGGFQQSIPNLGTFQQDLIQHGASTSIMPGNRQYPYMYQEAMSPTVLPEYGNQPNLPHPGNSQHHRAFPAPSLHYDYGTNHGAPPPPQYDRGFNFAAPPPPQYDRGYNFAAPPPPQYDPRFNYAASPSPQYDHEMSYAASPVPHDQQMSHSESPTQAEQWGIYVGTPVHSETGSNHMGTPSHSEQGSVTGAPSSSAQRQGRFRAKKSFLLDEDNYEVSPEHPEGSSQPVRSKNKKKPVKYKEYDGIRREGATIGGFHSQTLFKTDIQGKIEILDGEPLQVRGPNKGDVLERQQKLFSKFNNKAWKKMYLKRE